MVFSEYTKRRIPFHQAKGYRAPTVTDKLRDEGIVVNRKGVSDFLSQVEKTCSTARCPLYIHKLTLLLYLLLTRFQHHSPGHLPQMVVWRLYSGTLYTLYTAVRTYNFATTVRFTGKEHVEMECNYLIGTEHINRNGMERNNWNGKERKNQNGTEATGLQYFARPFKSLAIFVHFLLF